MFIYGYLSSFNKTFVWKYSNFKWVFCGICIDLCICPISEMRWIYSCLNFNSNTVSEWNKWNIFVHKLCMTVLLFQGELWQISEFIMDVALQAYNSIRKVKWKFANMKHDVYIKLVMVSLFHETLKNILTISTILPHHSGMGMFILLD